MSTLIKSHQQHQSWLKAIDLIIELNELCINIRSHRGTSTAQIEGDHFFNDVTEATAKTISEMFVQLDNQGEIFQHFEAHEHFFDVVQQWLQIQIHWTELDARNNFDQHLQLLESVQQLIWRFSDYYNQQQQDESDKSILTHYLLRTHMTTMESVACLRGIGCFYQAKKHLSPEDKKIMRDEIKKTYLIWSQRDNELNNLPQALQESLFQVNEANKINRFMTDFTQLLEAALKQQQYMPNGSEIFDAGSRILSVLNMQLNQGLGELKAYLPKTLEQWVMNTDNDNSNISPK